ncbi:MAG: hypothetical protein GX568_06090 [Candidatus Gastranaerophilales bacterium]|nr:hypothetical protein [Candidatus Gastranaerophilales bacterium]
MINRIGMGYGTVGFVAKGNNKQINSHVAAFLSDVKDISKGKPVDDYKASINLFNAFDEVQKTTGSGEKVIKIFNNAVKHSKNKLNLRG